MTTLVATLKSLNLPRIDGVVLVIIALLAGVWILDPTSLGGHLETTLRALASTAPYILFAIFAVAFLKATGAETMVAKAFEGHPARMITLAALFGGLSPFCSCEVIPFVAGLLALGAPLPAVMAFWLASPINDPAIFTITAGALGFEFAVAKAISAIGLGLMGGFVLLTLQNTALLANPLKPRKSSGCCGAGKAFRGEPQWRFWTDQDRRTVFKDQALENLWFLGKWLSLAYLLESFMISYIPAETIASVVGGEGLLPIMAGALAGIPAYLNGYAAPAVVSGLIDQGMTMGAGLAFMVAGGVTSIPAMAAVWALVRAPVFAAYLGLGFSGAVLAGALFQVWN